MRVSRFRANLEEQDFTVVTTSNGNDTETITYHPERDGPLEVRHYGGQVITIELDARYTPSYGDVLVIRFRGADPGSKNTVIVFDFTGGPFTYDADDADGTWRYESYSAAISWKFTPESPNRYTHNFSIESDNWTPLITLATSNSGAGRPVGPPVSLRTSTFARSKLIIPGTNSVGTAGSIQVALRGVNGFSEPAIALGTMSHFKSALVDLGNDVIVIGAGGTTPSTGRIAYSGNGGVSWGSTFASARDVWPLRVSASTWTALYSTGAGASGIQHTTTGGVAWSPLYTDTDTYADAIGPEGTGTVAWAVRTSGQMYEFSDITTTPIRTFLGSIGGTAHCIAGSPYGALAAGDNGAFGFYDYERGVFFSGTTPNTSVDWYQAVNDGKQFWLFGSTGGATAEEENWEVAYTNTKGRRWLGQSLRAFVGHKTFTRFSCDGEWIYTNPGTTAGAISPAINGLQTIWAHRIRS